MKSKVGLLIDAGMTVPRESFYTIFVQFPNINVLVYDKGGIDAQNSQQPG